MDSNDSPLFDEGCCRRIAARLLPRRSPGGHLVPLNANRYSGTGAFDYYSVDQCIIMFNRTGKDRMQLGQELALGD